MQGTESVGRALWLEERRRGLGGTDAAAVLGVSKWSSPHDVWLSKRGEDAEKPDSEVMWWGRELEDIIARRYMERTGRLVWNPERMLQHPEHPCLIGSPDRLVLNAERGLEVKTASVYTASEWGPEGTDDIPPAYLVQCLHYIALTGFAAWDVAVLIGGNDFRVYTVRRDESLERDIVARLVEWWERHVVAGIEPDITDSEGTRRWLAQRFPLDVAPPLKADHVAEGWANRLASARAALAVAEEQKAIAENNLKALIGDASGMNGPGWRVTWKSTKARRTVEWESIARRLGAGLAPEEFDRIVSEGTVEQPGSRRFLFTPAKE